MWMLMLMGQMHQISLKGMFLTNLADRSSEEHSFESGDLQIFYSHMPPVRISRVRVSEWERKRCSELEREEEREIGIREKSQHTGCSFQLDTAEWCQSNVQMSLTLTPSNGPSYNLLYANRFMFMEVESGMFDGSWDNEAKLKLPYDTPSPLPPLPFLPRLCALALEEPYHILSWQSKHFLACMTRWRRLCSLPQHSDGGCDVMLYVPFNNRTIAHCTYHNETSPRLHPIQCKNVWYPDISMSCHHIRDSSSSGVNCALAITNISWVEYSKKLYAPAFSEHTDEDNISTSSFTGLSIAPSKFTVDWIL